MNKNNETEIKKKKIADVINLLSENKRPEALEKILKLEKQYPEDLIIKQNVHLVYYKVGEVDKAINKIKEIIKINPDEFSNYHNLGIIYEKINKMKEAKYFFIKAVEKILMLILLLLD